MQDVVLHLVLTFAILKSDYSVTNYFLSTVALENSVYFKKTKHWHKMRLRSMYCPYILYNTAAYSGNTAKETVLRSATAEDDSRK